VKTGLATRLVAAIGAVLAIVGIFLDALAGLSYWDADGTLAWTGLILAAAALLLVVAGHLRSALDGWVFAIGAALAGYWAWFPAVTAFDDWDQTRVGMWLCLGGALLIAVGTAVVLLSTGRASTTPAGVSLPALVAGLGIVLVFPGIFLDADKGALLAGENGQSYWNYGVLGHSLGILILILAALSALAWGATLVGAPTHGLDSALTLAMLGLVAFLPVTAAFNKLGNVQAGGWLALAGGILAAGGTWAARGSDTPKQAPAGAA
jgi:hypothetical protein